MNLSAVKGAKAKDKFPDFRPMDYDLSLRENLFFYNAEVDDNKRKKEWALEYWKDEKKDIKTISRMHEGYFITSGALAHMIKHRGIELGIKQEDFLSKKYLELNSLGGIEEVELPVVDLAAIKEAKLESVLKTHIAEFEYGLDLFFQGEKFDAKTYLIKNSVKAVMARTIAEHFKPFLKELKLASSGKDEQLVEAYSHLTNRQLTKFIEYVQGLMNSCEVASAIVAASRKPRAKREKAPTEIVKAVKWLEADKTTQLKSEHPSKIVNSNEAWVYNSANRRIFRYVALPGMKLSIKGMTIINMDAEKSGGKIVRKPESLLKGIYDLTSRPLNKLYDGIRGTESRGVGRLNSDTLIIKCFN